MNIGILGATGSVGTQMIKVLEERKIKVDKLVLFASKKSEGKTLKFNGQDIVVETVKDDSFKDLDYVLGATSNELAKQYADSIVKSGAIFIDNSSAFRLDQDVPLVIPEINPEDAFKNKGIISNPNCSTIITCMAIYGINKKSMIKGVIASTYQAVSGAGINGIKELENQVKQINDNQSITNDVFPYQIAYNCIPSIGSPLDDGYTSEEAKMQNEGRKIMHIDDLKVTCTCIRVPVYRSHSISVSLSLENKLSIEEVKQAIVSIPNVIVKDDINNKIYPMPLDTTDKDIVEVGRIREDNVLPNGISLWCCGDQIRKGAATNAIQILETLIKG